MDDTLEPRTVRRTALAGRGLIVACVVLGVSLRTARGQDAERRPAPKQLGPFAVASTLAVNDIGFDSNVYNFDQPVSDFTFTVVPTFVATTGSSGRRLAVTSRTEFAFFAQQQSERSVNEDLTGSGRMNAGHLFIFGRGGYLNTRQRPTEEIDARSRRIEHAAEGGIGVRLSQKLSTQFSAAYLRTIFDGDSVFAGASLALELNRKALTLGGSVRYVVTPLTSIGFTAEVERTNFIYTPRRDTDSRRLFVGLETNSRALIAGSASIGVQRFHPLDSTVPGFDGVIGSADLRYRLPGASMIGVTFVRNLAYSYIDLAPYYVRSGFGLQARRPLIDRWDITAAARRFHHHYNTAFPAPIDPNTLDEHFNEAEVGVGYQARPGTRATFTVSYRDRQSEQQGYRSFDGVRVGASIVYAF